MVKSAQDKPIKLIVKSADDVTMLSAFLQDALVAPHDIHYDKAAKELVMIFDRYRWEIDATRKERVLMGLRIGNVTSVLQKKMMSQQDGHDLSLFYNLLQFQYEQEQDGSGALVFTFSAGAALRLLVEDLMMSAGDIAPPRPAIAKPSHDGA